ncbi:hypothetical protein ACIBQX_17380 [Nonomuraea sp. NPDC049714]|uniref:hypothetical protein n=1 Tax=Nonomuraea sp. NPDC049714 TaxID=3364357 RepID=UPI0037B20988
MDIQLVPYGGAVEGGPCPSTVLSWDGQALTAADSATGESVRVTPASLYHYAYDSGGAPVTGLAVLDADGLVMLDLPGGWYPEKVHDFTEQARIPVADGRGDPQARALLAGRAPGWRRLHGLTPPRASRWRTPLIYGVGLAGLALMAYLISVGAWAAWRGLALAGRLLIDVVEVKWLVVAFSPLLLAIRPLQARLRRYRARKGAIAGPPGGPNLSITSAGGLRIDQGMERLADIQAAGLLLYQYEDLAGLFVMNGANEPLHHIPGPWSPDDLHRFAERNGLKLAVHRISREEYLDLVRACRHASP